MAQPVMSGARALPEADRAALPPAPCPRGAARLELGRWFCLSACVLFCFASRRKAPRDSRTAHTHAENAMRLCPPWPDLGFLFSLPRPAYLSLSLSFPPLAPPASLSPPTTSSITARPAAIYQHAFPSRILLGLRRNPTLTSHTAPDSRRNRNAPLCDTHTTNC
jgi:hypothetical protein